MIEALLSGKAARTEDVLTSSVFGLLKFRPERLKQWLALAEDMQGARSGVGDCGHMAQEFWPQRVFRGRTIEPDLLLRSHQRALLIEAKWGAGLHPEPTRTGPLTGQIGKQWVAYRGEIAYLILVTSDRTRPLDLLERSCSEVEDKEGDAKFRERLRWLSWRSLGQVLEPEESVVDAELIRLLDRFDLLCFTGLRPPQSQSVPLFSYSYRVIPLSRQPKRIPYP